MNVQKNLEKQFSFLEKDFNKDRYFRNGELELIFTNKNTKILIIHYLMNPYHIDVIISKNGIRKNLLCCDELFDKLQLKALRELNFQNPKEQIINLSDFIKDNIDKLS